MAVIGVNYEEGSKKKDLGYKSVYVHHEEEEKIFNSGDFPKDWYEALKHALVELEDYTIHSSSVNHFIMDGAKFKSFYLLFEGDEPNITFDIVENGIEHFYDPKEKPKDWFHFRELVGHPKKI